MLDDLAQYGDVEVHIVRFHLEGPVIPGSDLRERPKTHDLTAERAD